MLDRHNQRTGLSGNASMLNFTPNGFDKAHDPLRPKSHQVLASNDGIHFTILGKADDPIELLKLEVERNHAVGFSDAVVRIVNEEGETVADFASYTPPPIVDGVVTPERIAARDRWMDAIMRWLLPARLYAHRNDPEQANKLQRWLRRKKIQRSIREDGGAARIFRNGQLLAEWGMNG